MKYNFSKTTKEMFPRYCMKCGTSNNPLEDHHIKGRRNELHSSSFNAIRLCKMCHYDAVQSDDSAAPLLRITYNYLLKASYKPNEKDYAFIELYINTFKTFI